MAAKNRASPTRCDFGGLAAALPSLSVRRVVDAVIRQPLLAGLAQLAQRPRTLVKPLDFHPQAMQQRKTQNRQRRSFSEPISGIHAGL